MPRSLQARTWILCLLCSSPLVHADDAANTFENEIRPLFAERCVKCHGPAKQEAGLRLDRRATALRGSDSGVVIVPGDPASSRLLDAVKRTGDVKMPPNRPLPEHEVAALERWIRAGAHWPEEERRHSVEPSFRSGPITEEERAFWSFQPVVRPEVPRVENESWCRTPIDRFILAKLEAAGLPVARDASRRTLARRLAFGVTGLPPTRDELYAFLRDTSPRSLELYVDRLLSSPHYGERWARHWLDVVRYADTAGETADYPVPLAWRYRNYVIDAFNADKPYDEFLREQIAGDILAQSAPRERCAELVSATGFLAVSRRFGFGIEEFQYLTIQDTIDTTGQAVLGLTIGCARCHDHKYDPINLDDYYAWYGIFDSTRYALSGDEKDKRERHFVPLIPLDAAAAADSAREGERQELTNELAALDRRVAELTSRLGTAPSAPLLGDFEHAPLDGQLGAPWDQRGAVVSAAAQSPYTNVNPRGTRGLRTNNDAGNNGCGCKLPRRTAAEHPKLYFNLDLRNVSANRRVDGSARIYLGEGPGISPAVEVFVHDDRFIIRDGDRDRDVARLLLGTWYNLQITLDLKERTYTGTIATPNSAVLFNGAMRSKWSGVIDTTFVDGYGGRMGVKPAQDIDNMTVRVVPIRPVDATKQDDPQSQELAALRAEIAARQRRRSAIKTEMQKLSQASYELAYAVREGKPHDSPIHLRGDPKRPGSVVPRRQLAVLGGQPIDNPGDTSGRLDLAKWLSAKSNPLTARVFVNRIWQHHFGIGLVATPNDFGQRGSQPSHPELLDWLASEFMERDWSVKEMHRLILSSRVYRLSSYAGDVQLDQATELERTRLFGRYRRRRLEAEAVRDAMLAVSGELDREPGRGHPFPPPSKWSYTQHGPFYAVYPTKKRSVYMMVQRLQSHPFLGLFDGPDPNATTAVRTETTTPTQALYLLNSPLVHEQATAFALRILAHSKDADERVQYAYECAFGRVPTQPEVARAMCFVGEYAEGSSHDHREDREIESWSALVRTLFARSEFLGTD